MHAIHAPQYNPTPMHPPRHLHIRTVWEHSPTRKKRMEMMTINYREVVPICVTAPIHLPGPTNPWALHLPTFCHVAPHTGVRVDPRGLLPHVRALCATCASSGPPTALPRSLNATSHPRGGPTRHVSSPAGPARHVSTCG